MINGTLLYLPRRFHNKGPHEEAMVASYCCYLSKLLASHPSKNKRRVMLWLLRSSDSIQLTSSPPSASLPNLYFSPPCINCFVHCCKRNTWRNNLKVYFSFYVEWMHSTQTGKHSCRSLGSLISLLSSPSCCIQSVYPSTQDAATKVQDVSSIIS